jgi:hypothetical protein
MAQLGGGGPKQRFAEIGERLKSGKYNSATRKVNRKYLDQYVSHRGEDAKGAVAARRAEALNLIGKINAYKSPKAKKVMPDSPPLPQKPAPAKVIPPSPPAKKANATKKAARPPREKTPPPPVRPRTPPPQKSDLYKQVDVKGDGNCFYRALYRAAAEHEDPKTLDKLFTILGADKSKMNKEDTGQAAIRAAIAAYYRTKFNERIGPFEMLAENHGSMQFRLWMREATSKQAKIYKKVLTYLTAKDGKKQFYSDLADVIGTNEEYASEIDYMVVSDILDAGGLKMVSTQTSPKTGIFDGKPALYIKRLSYDHYNYWKIKVKPKAAVNLSSKVAVAKPAPAPPAAAIPAPAPPAAKPVPKPAPPAVSSVSSNESTNNNSNEERRQELLEQLEKRMDKHTRCVEKCKALGKKVDAVKAALTALGKK